MITLYKNCRILPDRNFILDTLEEYLNTLEKTIINEFQYVRHGLEISIKINLNQLWLNERSEFNYNYVMIDNGAEQQTKPHFYFIINKRWISENTIQLDLVMDTLNTFKNDLVFDKRTYIMRQHKDRVFKGKNNKLYKKIDYRSEGITPLLVKVTDNIINDSGLDWYLVYKNEYKQPTEPTGENPVKCFLTASESITINNIAPVGIYNVDNLTDNTTYWLLGNENNCVVNSSAGQFLVNKEPGKYRNIAIRKEGSNLYLYSGVSVYPDYFARIRDVGGIQQYLFKKFTITGDVTIENGTQARYNELVPVNNSLNPLSAPIIDVSESAPVTINSIYNIDRTDPTLIKIIKLPYCPSTFKDGNLGSGEWKFNFTLQLPELISLDHKFKSEIASIFSPLSPLKPFLAYPIKGQLRTDVFESKIYHSDFYQPKIVYDSFAKAFALERVTINEDEDYSIFNIVFNATSTINSKFLLTFPQYDTSGKGSEDYDNILTIARNNEITIYNNSYINYLKAGYNYDVKNKERQQNINWLGVAMSGLGSIASFASSVATGPAGIAAGVGLLTSTASQVINAANSSINMDMNLDAKIAQLKQQSSSVAGADDVDLMSAYTGNKFSLKVYRPTSIVINQLFDVFYYTGYACNYLGVPDTDTRLYFNFVMADPVFKITPNIPLELLEDIKGKYNAGVTYMHEVDGEIDFDQVKENIEKSIL